MELGVELLSLWSEVGRDCDPTEAERRLVGAADLEAAVTLAAGGSLVDVFASQETSFAFLQMTENWFLIENATDTFLIKKKIYLV